VQLRRSRKLEVIDASLPWHGAAPAIERHRPRVALVCDEALDAVELSRIARQHPETGIVVVARRLTEARARVLDSLGAAAMLQRDVDRWLLVLLSVAVAFGIRGGVHMPCPSATACEDPRLARLSSHEAVVLELLKEHRQLAEIAAALGVSVETIRSQAKSIYRKLGVSSRLQLRALLRSLEAPAVPSPARDVELATRERVAFASRARTRWRAGWIHRPLACVR
jgi:DNA-binding NarL/FixJ family response regulator